MTTPSATIAEPEATPRRLNWRNVFLWLAGLLVLALLVLGLILLIRQFSVSRVVNESSIVAPVAATPLYVCNAVAVGTPVKTEGNCSFCTVNYTKPGEVLIAGETSIQYSPGAYVFQYNSGDINGFKTCIEGQPFFADTQYQPIWK